jgi:hypothetical protein
MLFNPHKLGLHKILKHIPLNAIFDAPYKARLRRAVNIADLRAIAKARAHKVCLCTHAMELELLIVKLVLILSNACLTLFICQCLHVKDGF